MAVRKPCPSCPWVVGNDATVIPRFDLELAEALVDTCPDARGGGPEWGAPAFACHQSRDGDEIVCAGWLAVVGSCHPGMRMRVLAGKIDVEALAPGEDWPELEPDFAAVIEKLRATA